MKPPKAARRQADDEDHPFRAHDALQFAEQCARLRAAVEHVQRDRLAQRLEQPESRAQVAQAGRDVLDHARLVGQKSRDQNGQGRVLGTAGSDPAI